MCVYHQSNGYCALYLTATVHYLHHCFQIFEFRLETFSLDTYFKC